MDTFTKQGILLSITVVVVMLVLLFTGGNDTPQTTDGTASSIVDQPAETTDTPTDEDPNSESAQRRINPQKWLAAPLGDGIPLTLNLSLRDAPEEIDAHALKLTNDRGYLNVPIQFESTARCEIGDLDLLLREQGLDSSAPFLISIEPLNGSTAGLGEHFSTKVDPRNIESGNSLVLRVPVPQEPMHYGLFICRDEANEGRCLNKRLGNINQLLHEHFSGEKKLTAIDRIYFFQYLLLDRDSFTRVNSLLDKSEYPKLESYLTKRTNNSFGSSSASAQAQRINAMIRSAPVEFSELGITLDLPRHDRGMCSKLSPKLPAGMQSRIDSFNKELRKKKGKASKQ